MVSRPVATKRPSVPAMRIRDLAEACLAEAAGIIERQGIEKLSLRDVAKRLGVSHQAPYKHFADRDALVAELVRRAFDSFGEALERRERFDHPAEDFASMGRAYLAFAGARPLQFRLMFSSKLPDPDRYPDMVQSGGRTFDILREGLARAFTSVGKTTTGEALDLDALFVWSSVHGLACLTQGKAFSSLVVSPWTLDVMGRHVLMRVGAGIGLVRPEEPKT